MAEQKVEFRAVVAKRNEFEAGIITRAMEDDAFRKALLDNPKAVIEKELGEKLPDELQIKALEETPTAVYIVVPPELKAEAELSDEALEKAAGGMTKGEKSSTGLTGISSYHAIFRALISPQSIGIKSNIRRR
jgi:hypothetical protein